MKSLAALLIAIPFSLSAQEAPTPLEFMRGIDGYEVKLSGRIVFLEDENQFAYYERDRNYGHTKFIAFVDSGREDRVKIQEECGRSPPLMMPNACKIEARGAVETTGSQVRVSITEVTSLER